MARSGHPSLVYRAVGALTAPVVARTLRLRVEGLDRLPERGGFVLAANHVSNVDPWPLGIPLHRRYHLRFMAKSELFWFPLGLLLDSGGAFRVRRGEGDLEAIRTAVQLCRQGDVVVIFPEGTRRRKGLRKKHRPRPHTGAARVALEARAPLVPAAIRGTDRLTRLGPVTVAYGAPVDVGGLGGADPRLAAQIVTDRLMAEIDRLEHAA